MTDFQVSLLFLGALVLVVVGRTLFSLLTDK